MSGVAEGTDLIAIDAGLRTGLAGFSNRGVLLWYRSQNFGARQRLKRAVYHLLRHEPRPSRLVVEGGGDLGRIWIRQAERLGISSELISAEVWRPALFADRDRRTGELAKEHADRMARDLIRRSGARAPTSLRHDAAEAILIGYWACNRDKLS